MDWVDWVRVAALLGMAYGAYRSFRNRPKPFRHEGRAYYPLPDGRFCTRWGRIIKDPALAQALAATYSRTGDGSHPG